jgi:hypothetical protein
MSEPNWQQKLEEIEAEIYNSTPSNHTHQTNLLFMVRDWFLALPNAGQVVVGIFAVMLTLSLLNTVFSLVKLLLSLSILGVIVYFGYQFLNKDNKISK